MEIAQILNERMKAIKETSTDTEVFKHIHAYIKYLLTTPELKAILDAEERSFYKKVKFTKDNIKLEQSNFYQAYFVSSFVRIYSPIENYWNTNEARSCGIAPNLGNESS
jgi:ADP-glucose pyrophosphorylase